MSRTKENDDEGQNLIRWRSIVFRAEESQKVEIRSVFYSQREKGRAILGFVFLKTSQKQEEHNYDAKGISLTRFTKLFCRAQK